MWGWLIIPALGLSLSVGYAPIVNGVHDTSALGSGIARLQDTTWGRFDGGRTVIIGHGSEQGAFYALHTLHEGDVIALFVGSHEVHEFRVTDMQWVTPDDASILTTPTTEYELVLITCSADESHRLIVRASPVEDNEWR